MYMFAKEKKTILLNVVFLSRSNFGSDEDEDSIMISDDDDLPKISKKSKASSTKKKRGITFDSDSEEDILPTKRKR